jgi:hypothetical protein
MNEEISDSDYFENTFFYFIKALQVLALDADLQCEQMGNYNVGWELQQDVAQGGLDSAMSPSSHLTEAQTNEVIRLARALEELPDEAISPKGFLTTNHEGSIAAMKHLSWVPLRRQATELLKLLEPAIERNALYFASN